MSNLGKKYRTKKIRRNETLAIIGFGIVIFISSIGALIGLAGI